MTKYYITLILILIISNSFAQKQTDNWYFGNNAGISFISGIPEPIVNSEMVTYEGCATISDSLGNLLFYTNGVDIWDKTNSFMQNGRNLLGDTSSTQSSIVIPMPGSENLYYVFTIDDIIRADNQNTTNGLRYSVVDMTLNDGLGAVTSEKNVFLRNIVSEKITAVASEDDSFVRVIAHDWGNSNFLSWTIDETGLNPLPTIQSIGTPHIQIEPNIILNSIGYMKVSPTGNKLALALLRSSLVEFYDYDINTGELSNPINIGFDFQAVYGLEFSADGSKLYVSVARKIFQIDLNAGTPDDIINSLTLIYEGPLFTGAMQLTPNRKIFCAQSTSEYLHTIEYPDSLFPSCNFIENDVFLDNNICRLGLPNFIQSYFKPLEFGHTGTCVFSEISFYLKNYSNIDSVLWNFGDPDSGVLNSDENYPTTHIYNTAGDYYVTLESWFNNVKSTSSQTIYISPPPALFLGNDTTLCNQTQFLLHATGTHLLYKWQDFSTDSVFVVSENGSFNVIITNTYTGCTNSDTINVAFSESPDLELGNDTAFCENSSLLLSAYTENCSYLWNNLSTEPSILVEDAGTYFVKLTNSDGCFSYDTIVLKHILLPRFDFGNDTVLCYDEILNLGVNIPNTSFLWQDESSENNFNVYEDGTYSLITENICGFWSDSISVSYEYCGEIYIPNIFTPNKDGINDVFVIKGIEKSEWELKIFNRWGEQIYSDKDYQNNWVAEGYSSGVYYYILSNNKTKERFNGTVRVVKN